MPAADLDLLVKAAEAAGDTALGYAGKAPRCWDKPGGAGPVTEADLAVNDVLSDILRTARPDYGWLSEESEDDPARLGRPSIFIVDPIDGTRSFIDGSRTWAHALAVARDGAVTAAVIYLPMREAMYVAAAGLGAFRNGDQIHASQRPDLSGASVLAARPTMNAGNWSGPVPEFSRHYRPSLAYRMACVAEGRFDAMLTLRETWEWDAAAGDLIVRESGGTCSDQTGAGLRFNNPRPKVAGILAGGSGVYGALLGELAASGQSGGGRQGRRMSPDRPKRT